MSELIGFAAGACTTIAFVPQVWRTVKTRDVSGIEVGMFLIFGTGVLLWLAYGVATNARPVILFNAITLVLVLVQIFLIARYRRR